MSAVGVNYSWGMDFSQEGAVVFRLESADYRTSASERTKRKIAQAFESVLKVKPFEKSSFRILRANVAFQDKPSIIIFLINTIWLTGYISSCFMLLLEELASI